MCTAAEADRKTKGSTGDMATHGDSCASVVPVLDSLKVHEGTVSHALLDKSYAFLESLRLEVTAGKVCEYYVVHLTYNHMTT